MSSKTTLVFVTVLNIIHCLIRYKWTPYARMYSWQWTHNSKFRRRHVFAVAYRFQILYTHVFVVLTLLKWMVWFFGLISFEGQLFAFTYELWFLHLQTVITKNMIPRTRRLALTGNWQCHATRYIQLGNWYIWSSVRRNRNGHVCADQLSVEKVVKLQYSHARRHYKLLHAGDVPLINLKDKKVCTGVIKSTDIELRTYQNAPSLSIRLCAYQNQSPDNTYMSAIWK